MLYAGHAASRVRSVQAMLPLGHSSRSPAAHFDEFIYLTIHGGRALLNYSQWTSSSPQHTWTSSYLLFILTSSSPQFTWTSSCQLFTLTSSSLHHTWTSSTQQFTLTGSSSQFTWTSSTQLFTLTSSSHQFTWMSSCQQFTLTSFSPQFTVDELYSTIHNGRALPLNTHGRAPTYYSY